LEAGALIEAQVDDYDPAYDLTTLKFPGGRLQATDVDALIGERVRIRIRARDVAVALSPPLDSSVLNVLPATIDAIAPQGDQVDLSLRMGDSLIKARITRLSCERLGLRAGQQVYGLIKSVSLDRLSMGMR
jgi:molybdate transport system ATP-binding protein